MQRKLAFEKAPSLMVPLRFFLTAPLFALAAALLLLWQGPDALVSRWAPFTLSLTHLLTLGVLAMVMIGALIQLLSVVAGLVIPHTNVTAATVHALLTAGTASLAAGFWLGQPALFKLALALLALAFGVLHWACATVLWRFCRTAAAATVAGMQMALVALALTVILGITLASALAWSLPLPLMLLTDLHVLWGFAGWIGLLVIGVAFQVIPMFQVTEIYPRPLTRWLAPGLFAMLAAWSLTRLMLPDRLAWADVTISILIIAGYGVFGVVTFYLLWHRKRPKAEATTLFWRTAMISLLVCLALWLANLPGASGHVADLSLTLGSVFIVGFAYSAINGMLYKIVPFLVWYHLQHTPAAERRIAPKITQIIPDGIAQKQFWAHLAGLLLLTAATLWPAWLTRPAALALGISSCWLWANLIRATRLYFQVRRIGKLPAVVA